MHVDRWRAWKGRKRVRLCAWKYHLKPKKSCWIKINGAILPFCVFNYKEVFNPDALELNLSCSFFKSLHTLTIFLNYWLAIRSIIFMTPWISTETQTLTIKLEYIKNKKWGNIKYFVHAAEPVFASSLCPCGLTKVFKNHLKVQQDFFKLISGHQSCCRVEMDHSTPGRRD